MALRRTFAITQQRWAQNDQRTPRKAEGVRDGQEEDSNFGSIPPKPPRRPTLPPRPYRPPTSSGAGDFVTGMFVGSQMEKNWTNNNTNTGTSQANNSNGSAVMKVHTVAAIIIIHLLHNHQTIDQRRQKIQ